MNYFLFGIYPYIALTVMFIGTIARYDRDQFSWKSKSSQLLRHRQFVVGSVFFHVGVLTIFLGHFFGLLTPMALIEMLGISHETKQIAAMAVGGIAGIFALIGGVILLHRRVADPRIRAMSSFSDTGILALLVLQLCLGLSTIPLSAQHIDGSEMVKFMQWAQGVFTFQPDVANHIADVSIIFKTHLTIGMTILLLFPFTRLVHILSGLAIPFRYLLRPGFQIVRSRRHGKHVMKPIKRTGG